MTSASSAFTSLQPYLLDMQVPALFQPSVCGLACPPGPFTARSPSPPGRLANLGFHHLNSAFLHLRPRLCQKTSSSPLRISSSLSLSSSLLFSSSSPSPPVAFSHSFTLLLRQQPTFFSSTHRHTAPVHTLFLCPYYSTTGNSPLQKVPAAEHHQLHSNQHPLSIIPHPHRHEFQACDVAVTCHLHRLTSSRAFTFTWLRQKRLSPS